MAISTPLHRLADYGESVWIDFLSRELLDSAALARAVEHDAVVGVTSNPTIFANALAGGDAYGAQIAAARRDAGSAFLALAMRDVSTACDLLRPVPSRLLRRLRARPRQQQRRSRRPSVDPPLAFMGAVSPCALRSFAGGRRGPHCEYAR
jgi:hypothetical protein